MDVNGSSRKRHVKSVTRARLLSALRQAPPFSNSASTINDELTEEDIFWSEDLAGEDHRFSKENALRRKVYGSTDSFTFLAAIPDLDQKQAIKTSSPQKVPRRAPDRHRYRSSASLTNSTASYHQSVPIRVPKGRTRRREFYEIEIDDEEGDGNGEMLPPHEVVARTWQRSPYSRIAAFSVLEGAGRTLKGRDLHQVRNAVWRQTGFLD